MATRELRTRQLCSLQPSCSHCLRTPSLKTIEESSCLSSSCPSDPGHTAPLTPYKEPAPHPQQARESVAGFHPHLLQQGISEALPEFLVGLLINVCRLEKAKHPGQYQSHESRNAQSHQEKKQGWILS